MRILAIESSCDETAAAVVEDGCRLLSNVIASSMDLHVQYGGVVPEIAARSHVEVIMPVINKALEIARCKWADIDAIAVTYGAGLGGSLLIGVLTARTLAITYCKPLYAVNHVIGHVYANFLTSSSLSGYTMPSNPPEFPMLAIIVSGGHSQLALFTDHMTYTLLGQTRDDAIGEAFDKVAKILGLPYPGGPSIAKAAINANATAYPLPIARVDGYDFSFSGLKTAVLRTAQTAIGESYDFPSFKIAANLHDNQVADIAASFQKTAVDTIAKKALKAYEEFAPRSVVLAGGVAANTELRKVLSDTLPIPVMFPDNKLCTDNAAMIATAGYFVARSSSPADPYDLSIKPNVSM